MVPAPKSLSAKADNIGVGTQRKLIFLAKCRKQQTTFMKLQDLSSSLLNLFSL